jgi:YfiH family protein
MSGLVHAVEWPAPDNVRAFYSERRGGVSRREFDSLNLATHVGDEPRHVAENRARLADAAGLPSPPVWLHQVHGSTVIAADSLVPDHIPTADAAYTRARGTVCAVLTADCVPVLLTDVRGRSVAAAHAGWRGLAEGVLQNAVAALACGPSEVIAWLGPAISAASYEVGPEVVEAFIRHDAAATAAFERNARGRWQADLYALARHSLAACGVQAVHGGGFCTFEQSDRFFSHRRESPCGRMATLIWREA